MSEPQIHWPQDMREDIQDRREFSHWLEAVADIDAQKKRNTKQKDNSMNIEEKHELLTIIQANQQGGRLIEVKPDDFISAIIARAVEENDDIEMGMEMDIDYAIKMLTQARQDMLLYQMKQEETSK